MTNVFFGRCFDGRSSAAVLVAMRFEGSTLVIVGPDFERRVVLRDYRLGMRSERGQGVIHLHDGNQVQADDPHALWRAARGAGLREPLLARAGHSWLLSLLALMLLGASLWAGYRYALPWLASRGSAMVPAHLEQVLGEQLLSWFDEELSAPSRISAQRQDQVSIRLARVLERAGENAHAPVLHFRSAPTIGANALALPGASMLVTDELVSLADHVGGPVPDAALLGVLVHEYVHLRDRHLVRRAIELPVLALASLGIWKRAGSLAVIAPAGLGLLAVTRRLEGEADMETARVLAAAGVPVEPLAALLQVLENRLAAERGMSARLRKLRWLRTHPPTDERIRALRDGWRSRQAGTR